MTSPLYRRLALVALCLVVLSAGLAHSAEVSADDEPGGHWTGVQLANAITQATGIAISLLLGVSSVGAWQYFHQPADQRGELPWFAQVWFWAPALIIVSLSALARFSHSNQASTRGALLSGAWPFVPESAGPP